MADKILLSELKDWYTIWNQVISNYGGGLISTLTTPGGSPAKATDVNALFNKIDEFKQDEYLKTEAQFSNTHPV